MSEFYYLLNTLPLLREGEPPPFSAEEFLRRCADWLTPEQQARLAELRLAPPEPPAPAPVPVIAAWHDWETDLRNRAALLRQAAVTHEAEADQRPVGPCFPDNERALHEAFAAPHPLERERLLDRLRWQRLEELETGWSFGFDRLCVYKLKLLLAEPWPGRAPAAGGRAVDALVDALHRQEPATATAGAARAAAGLPVPGEEA